MNYEICKKCKLNSFYYFYTIYPQMGKFRIRSTKSACLIHYNNYHLQSYLKQTLLCKKNKGELPPIIERYQLESDNTAEPDKNICPFYAEHMILSLNE